MRRSDFGTRERAWALTTLAAFVLMLATSTGAFAADPRAAGESCVGCPGCASGACRDEAEHPLESHHHCCTTCCLAHASLTLATAHATQEPLEVGPLAIPRTRGVIDRSQDAPYRPPRV